MPRSNKSAVTKTLKKSTVTVNKNLGPSPYDLITHKRSLIAKKSDIEQALKGGKGQKFVYVGSSLIPILVAEKKLQEFMKQKKFMSAPNLEVDGIVYDFNAALNWLKGE